jgi:hypothetical protein
MANFEDFLKNAQHYFIFAILIIVILLFLNINITMAEVAGQSSDPATLHAEHLVSSNPPTMNCCSQAINRFNINTMPYQKPIGYTNVFSTYLSDMQLPSTVNNLQNPPRI